MDKELTKDAVTHLSALLQLDTSNPPGNEAPAARYLLRVCHQEGIEARIVEPAPGRTSLLAHLPGRDPALSPLLLLSHLDTVPPGDAAAWRHPPFSGTIEEGALWGRGALDLKGKTVMDLMALIQLQRSGGNLERGVTLAALADEEMGSAWGMRWLLAHEPESLRCAAALGEGGGFPTRLGWHRFTLVATAEKGAARLHLRSADRPGHGALPQTENPLTAMARAVVRLTEASWPQRLTPTVAELLRRLGAAHPFPLSLLLRHLDRRLLRTLLLRLGLLSDEQERYFQALLQPTVSPLSLQGDTVVGSRPQLAEAALALRLLPGDDAERLQALAERWAGLPVTLEPVLPARESDYRTELFRIIEEVLAELAPPQPALPFLTPTASDAVYLTAQGVPIYGLMPLRTMRGEEVGRLVHGMDERLLVDDLAFGLQVTYQVVRRFCRAI